MSAKVRRIGVEPLKDDSSAVGINGIRLGCGSFENVVIGGDGTKL